MSHRRSACQLNFTWIADGTFSDTSGSSFAGQLDLAVLNPDTPGVRSTWLVDHPTFLSPGNVHVVDSGRVPFFGDTSLVFWPAFATVARGVAGTAGTIDLDFAHTLVFESFSVSAPGGDFIPFSISAESGLRYSESGLSAVPEPDTLLLVTTCGALALALRRRPVKEHARPAAA